MSILDLALTSGVSSKRRSFPTLGQRFAIWRSRRALAELDTHLLSDIGVSPKAAAREASKGFWDAPDTWKSS